MMAASKCWKAGHMSRSYNTLCSTNSFILFSSYFSPPIDDYQSSPSPSNSVTEQDEKKMPMLLPVPQFYGPSIQWPVLYRLAVSPVQPIDSWLQNNHVLTYMHQSRLFSTVTQIRQGTGSQNHPATPRIPPGCCFPGVSTGDDTWLRIWCIR